MIYVSQSRKVPSTKRLGEYGAAWTLPHIPVSSDSNYQYVHHGFRFTKVFRVTWMDYVECPMALCNRFPLSFILLAILPNLV